jgi:hypothetical protein
MTVQVWWGGAVAIEIGVRALFALTAGRLGGAASRLIRTKR